MQSTNRFHTAVVAITLPLLIIPVTVVALESDIRKPIDITSDRMDIDDGSGKSVYSGNVRLRQGSLSLRAGTLTVIQSPGEGKSSRIIAEGRPAILRQIKDGTKEKIEGRANRMEYTVNSKLLVMTGNASLRQGGETFKSDRIVYDRARSRIKAGAGAKGKERVRVTIGKGNP